MSYYHYISMSDIITLNVSGITYVTTKETLVVPNSYFDSMLSGKMKPGVHIDDAIFILRINPANGRIAREVAIGVLNGRLGFANST